MQNVVLTENIPGGISASGLAWAYTFYTILFIGIIAVFNFVLGYFVYRKAEKKGFTNAPMWGVITALTGVLGLVMFYILGSNAGTVFTTASTEMSSMEDCIEEEISPGREDTVSSSAPSVPGESADKKPIHTTIA